MKKLPTLVMLAIALMFIFAASDLGSAEGIGTVNQVGMNNDAYIYQEVLSEVVLLQLGDDNSSTIDQVGAEHLAGVAQVGSDNVIEIRQLGQRDLVFSLQLGMWNHATIIQTHSITPSSTRRNISDNDTYTYQSGLYNILNLMQIGDDNTSSVYQIDDNNEVFLIQEQSALAIGGNASFVVQLGLQNWAITQQLGVNQLSRSIQNGNDNAILINQNSMDNSAFAIQTGNQNSVIINQG